MPYKIITGIPNMADNETAVRLEDGSLIAVSCVVLRIAHTQDQAYAATARHIKEDGTPHSDAQGQFVMTSHRHTVSAQALAQHGDKVLQRECMLLVMGEEGSVHNEEPVINFEQRVRENTSIRRAIHSTAATHTIVKDIL